MTFHEMVPLVPVASIALLEAQAAIAFNAFVPHLALFVRQRRYNPWLVSAALLSVPFSIVFFRGALVAGQVQPNGLLLMFVVAPVVMAGSACAALRVGRLLVARSPAR